MFYQRQTLLQADYKCTEKDI